MEYLFLLCIAYGLSHIERYMSNTKGARGFVSVGEVTKGKTKNPPEKYRVLAPWLFYICGVKGRNIKVLRIPDGFCILKKDYNFELHNMFRCITIFLSLMGMYWYLQIIEVNPIIGILLYCTFLPFTFLTETGGERHLEIALWSLFLVGLFSSWSILILAGIVLLAALNRETSIYLIICYAAISQNWLNTIILLCTFLVGVYIPVLIYGSGNKQRITRITRIIEFKERIKLYKSLFTGRVDGWGFCTKEVFLNPFVVGALIIIGYTWMGVVGYDLISSEFNKLIIIMFTFMVGISSVANITEARIYSPLAFVMIPIGAKLLQ